jgi:transcriptional regulator with XRE-family HTH domain
MNLGYKVKRLRTERRWTQQELAARAGIAQPVISRLESHARANVHADVLKRLARALGCTADYLIGMYDEDEAETRELVGTE